MNNLKNFYINRKNETLFSSLSKKKSFILNKKKKIHRRYIPKLSCRVPRGIASKLVARVSSHDWHRNYDLIKLRRSLGMRIHARSELCETLTVLSSVLISYCNYSLYREYSLEISVPFEIVASSMNMLHIYDNGRKSYDPPLHALRILEQLKYIIVFRDINHDTGQYKPLRIWLTKKFFTSRGITIHELRIGLFKFEEWVVRNNLTHSLICSKNKHSMKMKIIGIDLLKFPSLRNLLLKNKRSILGSKLIDKAKNNIKLFNYNKNIYGFLNKNKDFNSSSKKSNFSKNKNTSKFWYCKFINWSITKMPYQIFLLEQSLRREKPELIKQDSEKYYKLLLQRGENI